jgi:3-deoxy-manno-octulosonate cytidylyltransferase (CMP-KDO synthetase)
MPSQPAAAVIVIPARLSSTRLPRKMLLAETGKTLIEHTWRAARRAAQAARVIVATDSEEIAAAVTAFGGEAVMTSESAPSGTARIVEALGTLGNADVIVNVQGDEPEISAAAIDAAIDLLHRCPSAGIATLVTPIRSIDLLDDPSAVKAELTPWREPGTNGSWLPGPESAGAWRAITFSRSRLPAAREWNESLLAATPPLWWQHVGLYAYRRSVLESWDALPESRLAALESLEQLRPLEAGIPIAAHAIDHAAKGIDTPRDYAAFVERCRRG